MKYILSILVMFAYYVNAQDSIKKCGAHIEEAKLWKENPELEAAYMQLQQKSTTNATYNKKSNQTYVIPIVFHVIHEYGVENISDEQIYRQVEILNEDFRKLNADTADIVTEFKEIAADANIEFVLATVDPFGNCTNGITRHYSSETEIGDDFSKFSQWPRGRYLNVWTVNSMKNGVAGYAFFPSSVEGMNRFRDGIIIRHNYIGDIGTSTPELSRALTHEIGHYLGLSHTWGPTNDPALSGNCNGDDGIEDTPNTIGWKICNLAGKTCDTLLDNVQNFMEYSYCTNMYTQGQVDYMHNILELDVSQRSNLWSQENLENSIPSNGPCNPVADFHANHLTVCIGEPVQFNNFTWRLDGGNNVTYTWTFEDGSVTNSNDENPSVAFTSSGWKDVTLTVEENGRTHTVTKENFLHISPNWPAFSGNVQFDFNDDPDYWIIENPQNNSYQWEVRNDAGRNGSGGIFLNTSSDFTEEPILFSPDYFFDERRGGVKSSFISQAIDMSYMSNISVSFDFACATDGNSEDEMKEKLIVYTSTNCGKTWQQRKSISGNDLVNNGSGWDSFYPINTTLWDTESFNLVNTIGNHVLLKFEYIGSDKSNNIAIDNININGTLNIDTPEKESKLTIYPNPSNNNLGWNINYDPSEWGGAHVQLTNVAGKTVASGRLPTNQSIWNIKPTSQASQGIYILKVKHNDKVIQNKLIIQ